MNFSFLLLLLISKYIEANKSNLEVFKENKTSRKSIRDSPEIEQSPIISPIKPLEKSHADPCLLRCKDEYMFYTTTNTKAVRRDTFAVGSPLNALIDIIISTEENKSPLDRIAAACDKHNSFLSCIRKCQHSIARQIIADGQQAMNAICQSFRIDKEFQNFVLPCLVRNGPRIGKSCQLHWSLMESDVYETISQRQFLYNGYDPSEIDKNEENDGFQRLCRAMNSYADCHLKAIAKLCHRRTIPFFVRFNAKISAALLQMLLDWFGNTSQLDTNWTECEQWEPQKLLKSVLDDPSNNAYFIKFSKNIFVYFIVFVLFLF
uniref:Uncharacterized protein n=1 Tax=Meloidogyne enterolobii TaxID=390850 RepID=A0A6V7TSG1_MELEN|nr:unnamed protein product [Meloidogyne enterolobii]